MNIFILNAGRCGSTTFIEACRQISNYTAGHESRATLTGDRRLAYPENHIEADNRLCWMLGRLDREYGDNAFYVHLTRNRDESVASFVKRMDYGIMAAYREGILMGGKGQSAAEIASDYLDTLAHNITLFLKDKHHRMDFSLERADSDFIDFWHRIDARGDLEKALAAWRTRYNASA
ncbi:MAG: hypothetical protein B6D72_04340 [gamma proteobacterium symbiont of Ctena orbiculata]|uniref:Uncharacterized protein n=1 Tax=Candidatus Thiodiazotropha taylori TaxID=2792791 RepID=A0A944M8J8_9GAMM|nr:hypothetical protein [Candidatus Thiodiazotropha taylori]PUB87250.1 MAG: hypothetical protein DBP00_09650 [gamma proteobacterium symbiont of Ctena orbiculata]MBT2989264.1 hypothetical protein [Candidatus Thiodiazotropha taylori]MBT2995527.1 hypothetical protein [Candidatus Thiodiazotropha taylori]MBT2999519.1 hypothetical protein [Candidatus Thiodiazotropha taylori]